MEPEAIKPKRYRLWMKTDKGEEVYFFSNSFFARIKYEEAFHRYDTRQLSLRDTQTNRRMASYGMA